MQHSAAMLRCMEELDAVGVRRLWKHVSPNMPQPKSDADALIMLHHARTQMLTMALKLRAYSHRWLLDHGYPSGLPDEIKPAAERMYPRVAEAVGIAVKGNSEIGRCIAPLVRGAMEYVVQDTYADHRSPDPVILKGRMMDARRGTVHKLLGR